MRGPRPSPRVHRLQARLGRLVEGEKWGRHEGARCEFHVFFTEGLFGEVLLLTYLYLPESSGRTFFPNLSKLIAFAAAPLVLTPFVRSQLLQSG